jgi:hypothetical protein
MFEFYDFFLVGYLVSVLAPSWHLTYGQSALMLLSSGFLDCGRNRRRILATSHPQR